MSRLPGVSVIIPAFNEEKRLDKCLKSVQEQDYSKDDLEIILVDDESTDRTVEIARKYRARVIKNGTHNIERGKSIGLKHASHDFILLLDADNILPTDGWLRTGIQAFLDNPSITGAEAIWFTYKKDDTLANRYCSLFGINDPVAFYLNKRDRLMQTERRWTLPGNVLAEYYTYYIIQFDSETLPTVGSQGFLTRKELLLMTDHSPYLFHMDSNIDLVKKGFDSYAMMKLDITHLHSQTVRELINKLRRNMRLFLEQKHLRSYTWKTSSWRIATTGLLMVTIIKPTYDALKGFNKIRDFAWFLHPVLCLIVPPIYMTMILISRVQKMLKISPEKT